MTSEDNLIKNQCLHSCFSFIIHTTFVIDISLISDSQRDFIIKTDDRLHRSIDQNGTTHFYKACHQFIDILFRTTFDSEPLRAIDHIKQTMIVKELSKKY